MMRVFPTFLRPGRPGAPHRRITNGSTRAHGPRCRPRRVPSSPKFHGAHTPRDGQQGPFTMGTAVLPLRLQPVRGHRGRTWAPRGGEGDVLEKDTHSQDSSSSWRDSPGGRATSQCRQGRPLKSRMSVAETALRWVRTADRTTSARPSSSLPPLDETISRMLASGCLSLGPR